MSNNHGADEHLEKIIKEVISFIFAAGGRGYDTAGWNYEELRGEVQKIIDYLKNPVAVGGVEVDVSKLDPYLKTLWEDFILWNTGKHKGAHDDQAERFVKEIGAIDHEPIAFMAFVAGRCWNNE